MRRHKILGDYREQATASLCSEMRTCGAVADVSNLDADSRLIQNVYQKDSKWRPSQQVSAKDGLQGGGNAPLRSPLGREWVELKVHYSLFRNLFSSSLQRLTRNLKVKKTENCSEIQGGEKGEINKASVVAALLVSFSHMWKRSQHSGPDGRLGFSKKTSFLPPPGKELMQLQKSHLQQRILRPLSSLVTSLSCSIKHRCRGLS